MRARRKKMDPHPFGWVVAVFLQNLLGPTAHIRKNESRANGTLADRRGAWVRTVRYPCRVLQRKFARPVPVMVDLAIRFWSRPESSDLNSGNGLVVDLFRLVLVDALEIGFFLGKETCPAKGR